MRPYYAVEILPSDDHHWVEVEITDNLSTANKFYHEWCKDMSDATIRVVKKENLQQSK
jgi:hypothetical protein